MLRRLILLALIPAAMALAAVAPPRPPPNDAALMADEPAPNLADYRLFTDAGARTPNARVTPYAIATPLFSDYAAKSRYFYLPPGKTAQYAGPGLIDFPVGTVLIKTFAYPADVRRPDQAVRKIETRLLIHRAAGWVALTYVWNDSQDQAVLRRAGLRVPVSFVGEDGARRDIDYAVPNVNQCKQCHSQNGELQPIGVKARNLVQLPAWAAQGRISGVPAVLAPPIRWDDASLPLERRGRAYLDANCGHCHSRAGLASNSGLYLTLEETDPAVLGVGKRPVAAGKGSGGLDVSIDPGHPDRSILLYRMASIEPGVMMPQLGRTVVHQEAVDLIRAYIAAMPATR